MDEISDTIRSEPPAEPSPEDLSALTRSGNALALDLWARLRDEPGNLAVCPASIQLALTMLWGGARGETEREMARVLRLEDQEAAHRAAAWRLHVWNDPRWALCELRVLNRLFGERTCPFEPAYLDLVRRDYGAPLEPMDFKGASEPSRVRINEWIARQTNQRIPALLPPGVIDGLTRLILVSSVCFKGEWDKPFVRQATRKVSFRTPDREAPAMMMRQFSHYLYADLEDLQVLEMSYGGLEIVMTILLPRAVDGLSALEGRVSPRQLEGWLARLRMEEVLVEIPRFRIDPSRPIRLEPLLGDMGMPSVFDSAASDLTGIAQPTGPSDRLVVGEAVHKAFVKTDETGTEAAGVVSAALFGASPRQSSATPQRFIADHPFLFLIRASESGAILFMGRVEQPGLQVDDEPGPSRRGSQDGRAVKGRGPARPS